MGGPSGHHRKPGGHLTWNKAKQMVKQELSDATKKSSVGKDLGEQDSAYAEGGMTTKTVKVEEEATASDRVTARDSYPNQRSIAKKRNNPFDGEATDLHPEGTLSNHDGPSMRSTENASHDNHEAGPRPNKKAKKDNASSTLGPLWKPGMPTNRIEAVRAGLAEEEWRKMRGLGPKVAKRRSQNYVNRRKAKYEEGKSKRALEITQVATTVAQAMPTGPCKSSQQESAFMKMPMQTPPTETLIKVVEDIFSIDGYCWPTIFQRVGDEYRRANKDSDAELRGGIDAIEQIFAAAMQYTKDHMSKYDFSHDFAHIERVTHMTMAIAIRSQIAAQAQGVKLDYNYAILYLAALLHDVGDKKYLAPGQDGTRIVHDFLTSIGMATESASDIQDVINHVSYSHEIKNPEAVQECLCRHPELAVVQDADRLDALGAVGISRAVAYAARVKPQGSLADPVQHFDDKLFKLQDMMKTSEGTKMAKERTQLLYQFKKSFEAECLGPNLTPAA